MKEKYLPIGTVVTLKDATKKIMIIGYLPMTKDNQMFDYSACTYPEGVITSDKTLAFNHSQIDKIDFIGLEGGEQMDFSNRLKDMVSGLDTIKQVKLPEEGKEDVAVNTPVSNSQPETLSMPMQDVNSIADIMDNN